MKKIVFICLSVLAFSLLLSSCKPNDQKLQKEIETAISTIHQGISATVKSGVATISGIVESEEAKTEIAKIIGAIKGIKSVNNDITVKIPESHLEANPDDAMTATITAALTVAGLNGINVNTKNGEVTLTGEVKESDLTKVMQIVNETNPGKVINQLKIK